MEARLQVTSGGPWESAFGYARAVRAGPWVAVSGTTAATADGSALGGHDVAAQTREALARVTRALEQAGARLTDVIRTRVYVTDIARWQAVADVHRAFFADVQPASTMVEVSALIDPSLLVEIEADAYLAAQ